MSGVPREWSIGDGKGALRGGERGVAGMMEVVIMSRRGMQECRVVMGESMCIPIGSVLLMT